MKANIYVKILEQLFLTSLFNARIKQDGLAMGDTHFFSFQLCGKILGNVGMKKKYIQNGCDSNPVFHQCKIFIYSSFLVTEKHVSN
jgi:hypothetical protein